MQLGKGIPPNGPNRSGTKLLIFMCMHVHTRRGRFEDCDVVGCAGEDGLVVVDVVDVHGHREVRHALLQRFVKLRRDLFLREWKHEEFEQPIGLRLCISQRLLSMLMKMSANPNKQMTRTGTKSTMTTV